jgi:hypothetical protein
MAVNKLLAGDGSGDTMDWTSGHADREDHPNGAGAAGSS